MQCILFMLVLKLMQSNIHLDTRAYMATMYRQSFASLIDHLRPLERNKLIYGTPVWRSKRAVNGGVLTQSHVCDRRPASAIRSVCIRFIGVCIIVSCKTCQKPNGGHRRQHYGCVCVFISAVECCDVLTDTRDTDPDTIQSNARVG